VEHKLEKTDAKNFVLAGKAHFTLLSGVTGTHYTYKVNKHKTDDIYFIKLLVGNNNDSDYQYIAFFRGDDMRVRTSSKSRMRADSKPVRAIQYLIENFDNLSPQLSIFHMCKCGRCGRTLTTPESITRGIGPECWDRLGGDAQLYPSTLFSDTHWVDKVFGGEGESVA